ncbi:hypothetical protein HC723_11790 [Vibrio sp. S11_S32]|uniref:TraU family protein n=1 Tax=Vibrio sp. S11_S32 TaxID=2720225 RepID=UPI00168107C9|nr:TraU family protein [Vibrio sp. S11_S32]MBD1577114.1 hypothetical protein [Vibrio sp. S11_S32]
MKLIKAISLSLLIAGAIVIPNVGNATEPVVPVGEDTLVQQLVTDYKSSLNVQCIDHQILGVCIWTTIRPWGVQVKYSPMVSMYSPDAKVEVTHTKKNPPYKPAKINDKVASYIGTMLAGKITKISPIDNGDSSDEGFRSVHLMGNPVIQIHDQTLSSIYNSLNLGYCSSNVQPFQTYFHSDLDLMEWRFGILEQVYYPINIMRRVMDTKMLSQWGTLYPRTGWVVNSSPYIGAALVALRAANIANGLPVDNSGIHVVKPMPLMASGKYLTLKSPIVNIHEGRWQPTNLGPAGRAHQAICSKFPTPAVSIPSGTLEPYKGSRGYIFTLWRKYTCCEKKGDIFSGTI